MANREHAGLAIEITPSQAKCDGVISIAGYKISRVLLGSSQIAVHPKNLDSKLPNTIFA